MYCGYKVQTTGKKIDKPVRYEYYEFDFTVEDGEFLDLVRAYADLEFNRDGLTKAQARVHFWQEHQSEIMPVFQELMDEGWEPITKIGPECVKLIDASKRKKQGLISGLFNTFMPSWGLVGFYVKFRRSL